MKRRLFLLLIVAVKILHISIDDLASTAGFAFLKSCRLYIHRESVLGGGLDTCDHGRLVVQKAAAADRSKSPSAS